MDNANLNNDVIDLDGQDATVIQPTTLTLARSTKLTTVTKKVEPKMFVSYRDTAGKELAKLPRPKGRLPKGHRIENGLIIVDNCTIKGTEIVTPKSVAVAGKTPFYITVSETGAVLSKSPKKRGIPVKGFVKHDVGEFAGNYVKVVTRAELEAQAAAAEAAALTLKTALAGGSVDSLQEADQVVTVG